MRFDHTLLHNAVRWARHRAYVTVLGSRVRADGHGLLGRRSRLRSRGVGHLEVGPKLVTGDDVLISAVGTITIGRNLFVNDGSRIVAHDRIRIGDDVVIASYVSILDHDHRTHARDGALVIERADYTSAPVTIGSNVWLGDKATVLKGVTIGDNVIVGANSVVTRDVPAGSVVAGIPAKVIRTLDL